MTAAFEAHRLLFAYEHTHVNAVNDISLAIEHGTLCAVIGPNGSGKSTLLRLLLGSLAPLGGSARFEGRDACTWNRAELARRIGVVTQAEDIVFPLTVRELVGMGRYPHMGPYRGENADDRAAIAAALEYCALTGFEQRTMSTLSGGERQRARIARALAQKPRVLVLDEPTAALDVAHEMSTFELLDRLTREDDVTVVLVTHNINLASRYASQIVLLERGSIAGIGAPATVVTQPRIQTTYQWPVTVHSYEGPGPDTGAPQVAPLRKEEP
ncbi:MAG: ABC transporter ATP-binding protein [Longimicrobiales bacterium]